MIDINEIRGAAQIMLATARPDGGLMSDNIICRQAQDIIALCDEVGRLSDTLTTARNDALDEAAQLIVAITSAEHPDDTSRDVYRRDALRDACAAIRALKTEVR